MDEQEAIQRLRSGDIGGLAFLVRQYQVRAVRSAYLVTRDVELAQDVTQSAFLKAYERIQQFDTRKAFAPWFLTIVLRDAIKAARERERYVSYDWEGEEDAGSLAIADGQASPEAYEAQAETVQEVLAALDRLAPGQRAAVVARYYLSMSEAETAAALSLPRGTVKSRLNAARQRLRLLLNAAAAE